MTSSPSRRIAAFPRGTMCSPSGTSPLSLYSEHIFHEEDRVVIPDAGLEKPLGIGRRGWSNDVHARHIGKPHLEHLRVLRGKLVASPTRGAHDERRTAPHRRTYTGSSQRC